MYIYVHVFIVHAACLLGAAARSPTIHVLLISYTLHAAATETDGRTRFERRSKNCFAHTHFRHSHAAFRLLIL